MIELSEEFTLLIDYKYAVLGGSYNCDKSFVLFENDKPIQP